MSWTAASCGNESRIGALLAFTQGLGDILRCSACENVMLRIVRAHDAVYLDARRAVYVRLARAA